ncbi:MAG: hypothetical protein JSR82_23930 [Verrucomicrobia bacterium]|nr:hypothetical protein [Verrucomicrobiota bacterium]
MATDIVMSEANYAPLLAKIEAEIVNTDEAAAADQIPLTDSQIRSALNRVGLLARGARPEIPAGSPRDRLLSDLTRRLIEARQEFRIQIVGKDDHLPVPVEMWLNALGSVMESIRRHGGQPGSRAYLEFARDFVRNRLRIPPPAPPTPPEPAKVAKPRKPRAAKATLPEPEPAPPAAEEVKPAKAKAPTKRTRAPKKS